VDTTKAITHIGLCAGYGGIELGLKRVLPTLRTVALCEIEAFACANLVAKMEAGLMDPAPVWTDLKTFPWQPFRNRVDILSGGYPCQPFSAAGKRLGADDPRHLWPSIARGIAILRPRVCFFENVEGHISLGLSTVVSDLEQMGYEVSWGLFSAAECGAPHQRKRVFVFAYTNSNGVERYRNSKFIEKNRQGRENCQALINEEFADIDWKSESARGLVGENDGGSDWVDRVRLLGNGVVPATAEKAFRTLINQF
jgi:DNA-cytosine methyltransferase